MQHRGFIMFYAVIIIGIMAGAASAVLQSTRTESSVSLQTAEATKAALAADAGLECVRYWQLAAPGQSGSFSPNSPGATVQIDCGVNGAAPVTISHPHAGQPHCLGALAGTSYTHAEFTVGPFGNAAGACARVRVTVDQVPVNSTGICALTVESRGLNNCADPSVERVLWESI